MTNRNDQLAERAISIRTSTPLPRPGCKPLSECDRFEEQVQQTADPLEIARAEVRALSAHLLTVQEEERRRIACELHDDLAQRTAMIEMELDHVARFVHHAEGIEALSAMRV